MRIARLAPADATRLPSGEKANPATPKRCRNRSEPILASAPRGSGSAAPVHRRLGLGPLSDAGGEGALAQPDMVWIRSIDKPARCALPSNPLVVSGFIKGDVPRE